MLSSRTVILVRAKVVACELTLACACALACLSGALAARQAGAPTPGLSGTVRDRAGAAVAGAAVALRASGTEVARATTDSEGKFALAVAARPPAAAQPAHNTPSMNEDGTRALSIVVRARGFAALVRALTTEEIDAARIEIVLAPAAFAERMAVTATGTEKRLDETAASVAVLSERDVETTAALRLDDALRQVVGFSLFRRTGSRAANPTTQGVSLRGTGATGASRALVVSDGVPLNDPFGGWVYWDEVPRAEVARVEVLRGGASALYGGGALSGVVNILRQRADANVFSLEASYGNEGTPDANLYASATRGAWAAGVGAEIFRTDGYVVVEDAARGRVDTRAGARDSAIDLTLERRFATTARAFLRGSLFGEARQNGTPLQTNRTHARQLSAGFDMARPALGSLTARLYGGAQIFDQNFSAVAADRSGETLARAQRSPSQSAGASVQWSRAFGNQNVVAGVDAREVRGSSDETVFSQGRATSLVGAGGRERDAGVFVEDVARIGARLILAGGARFDHWRNYDAASTTRPLRLGASATTTAFAERDESALSPRASALFRVTPRASISTSAYRAFRQPTLNELYRSFRVGDIVTLANENLRAERLAGGEAGANFTTREQNFDLRATLFWTEITRPVANVTLAVAPALITRQRQNLGRTRARGVEVEAEARLGHRVSASGGYLFVSPTVVEFPASSALEGLRVAQVARQQLTFQLRYDDAARWTASLQGRASGAQFDDDQNLFRLAPYFTLDAYVARRLRPSLALCAAVENLFNQRYEVGRTPLRTLGPPLLVRFGFRVRLGSR